MNDKDIQIVTLAFEMGYILGSKFASPEEVKKTLDEIIAALKK